jgi:hypothetical protein
LAVDGLTNLHGGVLESLKGLSDFLGILSSHSFIEASNITLNLILDVLGNLTGVFLKLLLGVVHSLIGFVLEVDSFTSLSILLLGCFGILDHLIDLRV